MSLPDIPDPQSDVSVSNPPLDVTGLPVEGGLVQNNDTDSDPRDELFRQNTEQTKTVQMSLLKSPGTDGVNDDKEDIKRAQSLMEK